MLARLWAIGSARRLGSPQSAATVAAGATADGAVVAIAMAALVGALLLSPAQAAGEDDPLFRLGHAKHLERVTGDVPGALRIYEALRAELSPEDPLRAEVCLRVLSARLQLGAPDEAAALAAEPFRELADRLRRRDLIAEAEMLLDGALAWGEQPGAAGAVEVAVRAVDPSGRSFAIEAGREAGLALGDRVTVSRAGRRVGRAVVFFVGRGLAAAALIEGEVEVGCAVTLPARRAPEAALGPGGAPPASPAPGGRSEAGLAPPPLDAGKGGPFAEARALLEALVEQPSSGRVEERPDALTEATRADLYLTVVSVAPSALAGFDLRFEPLRPAEVELDALGSDVAGVVALLGEAEARALSDHLATAPPPVDGPREGGRPLAVLRRDQPVALPVEGARQLAVGTWRLPPGDQAPRFEGLRIAIGRLTPGAGGAAPAAPGGAAATPPAAAPAAGPPAGTAAPAAGQALELAIEATAIDLPRAATAYPGADGPVHAMAPRTQRIRGRLVFGPRVRAVAVAGLHDPFAGPGEAAEGRLLLLVLVRSR